MQVDKETKEVITNTIFPLFTGYIVVMMIITIIASLLTIVFFDIWVGSFIATIGLTRAAITIARRSNRINNVKHVNIGGGPLDPVFILFSHPKDEKLDKFLQWLDINHLKKNIEEKDKCVLNMSNLSPMIFIDIVDESRWQKILDKTLRFLSYPQPEEAYKAQYVKGNLQETAVNAMAILILKMSGGIK